MNAAVAPSATNALRASGGTAQRFTKITDANGVHVITRDEATGLEWSARDIGNFTNKAKGSEAAKACTDLTLGGHSDWRLPTIEELESIRDRSRYSPAIDTDAFPDCPASWFWSSTPDAESPNNYAWIVDFSGGLSGIGSRDDGSRVRAVRGPARQSSASLPSEAKIETAGVQITVTVKVGA